MKKVITKVCKKCLSEKSEDSFGTFVHQRSGDIGIRHWCKSCQDSSDNVILNTKMVYEAFSKVYLYHIEELSGLSMVIKGTTIELIFVKLEEMENFKKKHMKFVSEFFRIYVGEKNIRVSISIGRKNFPYNK